MRTKAQTYRARFQLYLAVNFGTPPAKPGGQRGTGNISRDISLAIDTFAEAFSAVKRQKQVSAGLMGHHSTPHLSRWDSRDGAGLADSRGRADWGLHEAGRITKLSRSTNALPNFAQSHVSSGPFCAHLRSLGRHPSLFRPKTCELPACAPERLIPPRRRAYIVSGIVLPIPQPSPSPLAVRLRPCPRAALIVHCIVRIARGNTCPPLHNICMSPLSLATFFA